MASRRGYIGNNEVGWRELTPAPKPERKKNNFKKESSEKRAAYKRAHPICEFSDCIADKYGNVVGTKKCYKPTDDLVHLVHRGMGGTRSSEIESEDNYMSGCREHHRLYDGLERDWIITREKRNGPLENSHRMGD